MAKGKKKVRNAPSTKNNALRMRIDRTRDREYMDNNKVQRWEDIHVLLHSFENSVALLDSGLAAMIDNPEVEAIIAHDEYYFIMLMTVASYNHQRYDAFLKDIKEEIRHRRGRVKTLDEQFDFVEVSERLREWYDEFMMVSKVSELSLAEVTDAVTMGNLLTKEARNEHLAKEATEA